MRSCLSQYFRCPEHFDRIVWKETSSAPERILSFWDGLICFGSYHAQQPAPVPAESLNDALVEVDIEGGKACLPFNPSQVVENLHNEAYASEWRAGFLLTLAQIYYFVRPVLPVFVRRHLQMLHLRGWRNSRFPSWPVDCSVDNLLERLMMLSLQANGKAPDPVHLVLA